MSVTQDDDVAIAVDVPIETSELPTKDPLEPTDDLANDDLCDCCHCIDVFFAQRRAKYLQTPEGQKRLDMKMFAKNLFMDIMAMDKIRNETLNKLHGTQQKHPSPRVSFPVSIVEATKVGPDSIEIKWYIHELTDIDRYEFLVDDRYSKTIYNPKVKSTILVDVCTLQEHRITMRAIPRKGIGANAKPLDLMVEKICCGLQTEEVTEEILCHCANADEETVKQFYAQNKCKATCDFWQESEFLYMPQCQCICECDCDMNAK